MSCNIAEIIVTKREQLIALQHMAGYRNLMTTQCQVAVTWQIVC